MRIRLSAVAVFAFVSLPLAVCAEEKAAAPPPAATSTAPGIKRTILQKFDVPGSNFETTVMKIEFVPDHAVGAHTHPGTEASYVLDGEITMTIGPDAPRTMKVGDTVLFAAGVAHGGKAGPKGVTVLNTYVLEKGKPFITPFPPPSTTQDAPKP